MDDWYRDALIYEVHVRAFYDSNADGIGDFPGLRQRLPYLQDLGITCLWLLPFYPSPLRDDGYDIADYTSINPIYGTLDDFKRLLDDAHSRNIKVLTELVINHTSDQHPWFQRARRAPRGSPERDFYVWSDTDTKYAGTRIIFVDTEKSNWTFDPVAGQYYWHRFFSHQPDLNFDNPAVLEAVLEVMRFWLDMGVDGMRLDAIPYLIEREGTINENLPETHAVLRQIRQELDRRYTGRVFLAEANQWPADVRAYFGEGDECHMCFHFPLMPRMFMAIRQEERHPIIEIMNQTPDVPDACQWAIFLRNHDELTLEMVTDEERDYMYAQYAVDPQMRLNLGIRRRLAPLMDNTRSRIELMNSLLFSMPGTPIIYYGDEIGMGDNVYLGDRNGVRTPMQWSSDRNAGFSRADPARLYFPVIMDPVYGYEAINVEAQERSPASLLQWMKRMIALRRQHAVFGRGTIEFIRTDNRKVITYVRRYEQQMVLCVANLARTVQPVSVPLAQFAGLTPVELLGQTEFPRIGEQPYFLTLAPYGFYWFSLQETVVPVTARIVTSPEEHGEWPVLFAGVVWDSILDGSMRNIIERQALLPFLQRQRWFGGKSRIVSTLRIADWVPLRGGPHPAFLSIIDVTYRDNSGETYSVPLAMTTGPDAETIERQFPHAVVARISGARKGLLYDGLFDDGVCTALLAGLEERVERPMRRGTLQNDNVGLTRADVPPDLRVPITRMTGEQSNTSIKFGQRLVLKAFRRLESGVNPDVEIGRFLSTRTSARVPQFLGDASYVRGAAHPASMFVLQRFVWNQGMAWNATVEELGRFFERALGMEAPPAPAPDAATWLSSERAEPPQHVGEAIRAYLAIAQVIGRRTGELHLTLADSRDADFAPEANTRADLSRLASALRGHAVERMRALKASLPTLEATRRDLAQQVLDLEGGLHRRFDLLDGLADGGARIRVHGDYHLGQLLITEGDVVIIDFEGEPTRPMAERRAKTSPLRDVAGMIRSFGYATAIALGAATSHRAEDRERLTPWAQYWEQWVGAVFLRAYRLAMVGADLLPGSNDAIDVLLRAYEIDKAFYELGYELSNRPDWIQVPLTGLLQLLRQPAHASRTLKTAKRDDLVL
jgi:maltose alpha-D-glucosyltransferase/alpha-amylase